MFLFLHILSSTCCFLCQAREERGGHALAALVEEFDERVVRAEGDDDLDTGSGFEGTDVTPFTADDTALDLIALDVEDGDGVLDSRFGRQASVANSAAL